MKPDLRDWREERDWWRIWHDPPGLICCCAGPTGPKTQIAYCGIWGGATQPFANTYITDTWTNILNAPFSGAALGFFTTGSNPYGYEYSPAKLFRYNTGIGTWTTLTAGFPTGTGQDPQGGTGVVSGIEHGYLIGGQGGLSPLAGNEQYTVSSDTFAAKTSMPATKEKGGGETMSNKIYCFQGLTGSSFPATTTNTNYEYDPVGDSWATKTAAGNTYHDPTSSSLSTSGPILSAGGATEPGTVAQTGVQTYVVDTWTTRTSLPSANYAGNGAQYGSAAHIWGGINTPTVQRQYVIDTFSSLATVPQGGQANGASGSW